MPLYVLAGSHQQADVVLPVGADEHPGIPTAQCGGVDASPEISAINISRATQDPFNALIRHVWTGAWAPKGANWGHHGNPAMDKLIESILAEFDTAKRLVLLTQLHEMMSEEAVLIFVAHDLNPRAMSPKVKGFVQAQSWFQDLTPVTLAP